MGINAVISFLLEIIALCIYGWAPFQYIETNSVIRSATGAFVVVVVIAAWARLAAPMSAHRLHKLHLLVFKTIVFVPATILIGLQAGFTILIVGLLCVAINLLVEYRHSSPPSFISSD